MSETITTAALDASPRLFDSLLSLNNDHAVELSWADKDRFRELINEAFFAQRIGTADAMLIAFDQDAQYDSPNFLWFRERFPSFVYVDRVVTAAVRRGRGHARNLYRELIAQARLADHERIVCEVNSDPPNPISEAFHQTMSFEQVGMAVLANGKTVTYLALTITAL